MYFLLYLFTVICHFIDKMDNWLSVRQTMRGEQAPYRMINAKDKTMLPPPTAIDRWRRTDPGTGSGVEGERHTPGPARGRPSFPAKH